ncbi:ECF RNA polymerase sigma factor SigK [Spelaeicoccus albus]|uniref:RNA polymerase sigma-70 factor (ECF subfamily) n=1 Tax=Spelaeicoccus albus TaxID=1280376 RepID=A0A7Z0AC66_9MICO|nr:ECF RNA polymerase sigma factor SigK [Spelaeicoccus albus]NYI66486.1 RNA polymerase sigma-70 factor (ECF subfamily) [Spelaeicoccus albus]
MESDLVSAKRLARLIERTADGDQAAFAELYDATAARVYGMARRVLIDPNLSEDATQEAYLQVWREAGRYSPAEGSAISWLITIAHRRAVDKVRSERARSDREDRYESASAAVAHDEVAEAVAQHSEAEQVMSCMGTLTDSQRESITLAYYAGLTYRQVAERVHAGLPAVKSRIRDGLLRLKKCLGVNRDG